MKSATEGPFVFTGELKLTPDPEIDTYTRVNGYHIFTDKDGTKSLWRVSTAFQRLARSDDTAALIEAMDKMNNNIGGKP